MYKLKKLQILFIADFNKCESDSDIIKTLTVDSPNELVEELFKKISDPDDFYSDSYMDNPPFHWKISKVKAGDDMFL